MGTLPSKLRFMRSLKLKFALLVIVLLSVISVVLSFILINQSLDTAKKNLYQSSKAFAELSVTTLGNYYNLYYHSGYVRYLSLTKDIYQLEPSITNVQIISVDDGQILADSSLDQANPNSSPVIVKKITQSQTLSAVAQGSSLFLAAQPGAEITQITLPYQTDFGSRPFSISYTLSYQEAEAAANQSRLAILLVTILVALIAGGIITWTVNRSILTPVSQVIKSAEKIAAGDLTQTVHVQTHDEIEDLAQAVNNMAQKLSKNIDELKQLDEAKNEFIMIASHNLRTPLTVLQGYLPLLVETTGKKKTDPDQEKFYVAMQTALARLNKLVEELLSIVSLRQAAQMNLSSVSLQATIEAAIALQAVIIEEKKIKIISHLDSSLVATADKGLLVQAIEHVLDNAVKFSPAEGEVNIALQKTDNGPELKISDHGPGMTQEQQDHLFEMFHRESSVLNYNYEGVGLGLYVARLTLTKFNAQLKIQSKEAQGTTIIIQFPKMSQVQAIVDKPDAPRMLLNPNKK